MKININSWHYRWGNWLQDKTRNELFDWPPQSLCGYFWGFVSLQLMGLVVALSITIVAIILGGIVFCMTIGLPVLGWSAFVNGSERAELFFYIFGTIDLIILGLISYLKLSFWYENASTKVMMGQEKPTTMLKITETIIKTKGKVCPLLRFG